MRSLPSLLALSLLLISCSSVKAPQGSVSSNTSSAVAKLPTLPPSFGIQIDQDTPQAIVNVRDYIAVERKLSPTAVAIGHMQEMNFPDTCLAFPAEGENCAPEKVKGYMIMAVADGMVFTFHVNESGDDIRLVGPHDIHIAIPLE